MNYRVVLIESEEGFAVSCPALPGCHSQGATKKEAITNIKEAIQLWLEVAEEDEKKALLKRYQNGKIVEEMVRV